MFICMYFVSPEIAHALHLCSLTIQYVYDMIQIQTSLQKLKLYKNKVQ